LSAHRQESLRTPFAINSMAFQTQKGVVICGFATQMGPCPPQKGTQQGTQHGGKFEQQGNMHQWDAEAGLRTDSDS